MSFIRSSVLLLSALAAGPAVAAAQIPTDLPRVNLAPTDTLPRDTVGIVGTLPNGLKYYIRGNKKPEGRAEFRLVIKAGSLMEDEDQRGLAHWAEHMAFNGTKNFAKNDLIHHLQGLGVKFGADLNAMTTFDHTMYILPIPTTNPDNIKVAIDILEDWAHRVTFDSVDFEEERGVIQAEMRTRLGVQSRASDFQIPILFQGSKYAERLPIGTKESLANATLAQITRFYKTWYRPDLMGIVAVGDFDEKEVERLIVEQFSTLQKPAEPIPNTSFPVPEVPGTRFAVFSDPEVTGSSLAVINRRAVTESGTVRSQREGLIRSFYASLVNQRIAEKAREQGAKFLRGGVQYSAITRGVPTFNISVETPNNMLQEGLTDVMNEIRRAGANGFSQSELDRLLKGYKTRLENFYLSRNDRTSDGFVNAYVAEFFNNIPIASPEVQIQVMSDAVNSITLADINKEAADVWHGADSRLIIVSMPQREGIAAPDSTAILAVLDDNSTGNFAAYSEDVDTLPLIEKMPKAGKVVSEKSYDDVDIVEWELSNGIKVLSKITTNNANQIIFSGFSPGGTSLIPDSEYPTAAFLGSVAGIGGVARFTPSQLGKKLAGQSVNVSLGIGQNSQTIGGSSTKRDLKTMFELLYLRFTAPRFDSAALEVQFDRAKKSLDNREADPMNAFRDTITATITQGHKRFFVTTPEILDQVDRKRAFELFKDRISNPGAFTLMFVGDFNRDTLKAYVEQYVASLPSTNRKEVARDLGVRKPTGVVKKEVFGGKEDKATTIMVFHGGYEPVKGGATQINIMAEILNSRLLNVLREEMSGTYGVSTRATVTTKPVAEYVIEVSFVSEPKRKDELVAAALKVIEDYKVNPPTAQELKEVVEPILKSRREARQTNQFWLGALALREENRDFSTLFSDSVITDITPVQLQQMARRYLNPNNYMQFDLLPEKK